MKRIALSLAVVVSLFTSAQAWELVSRGSKNQALLVSHETANILTAGYVFWGPKWAFSGPEVVFGPKSSDGTATFKMTVPKLGITAEGTVSYPQPNVAVWKWDFEVAAELKGIIGGGLDFQLALDSTGLQGFKADPVLLPDHTGWKWEVAKDRFIEVQFSEPQASVYFERGNKNDIRAMFFGADVPAGKKTVTMTVTLPEGGKNVAPITERYGEADTSTWFKTALNPDKSFIDLSYLNETPAGKHGFVRAKGDQFVFDDGTPVRFWGANVQAYSLFVMDKDGKPNKELIDRQAKRLAQLGFNLVRLHHHDSGGWVKPNLIAEGETSQKFNESARDVYFYWIKALQDNGIYVWVDLHVGRQFKPGDEIPGQEDLFKNKSEGKPAGAEAKGFCYLNERIEELMKKFNEELLTTVNPYTGKAIKDDPAVMGMLITNENDLTHHFGNLFLADKNNPWHQKKFEELAEVFSKKYNLDRNAVRTTWQPGVSKLFLNDLEYAWCNRMIEHLRKLGVKVPVTSGHQWSGTMFSLPALTCSDMIDVHTYSGGEFLNFNPRFQANFAHDIGASQLADRPLTITEYNDGDGGAKDPFTIPLYVGALSAFQGWDGPMMYGYSQDGFRGGFSAWSSYNLPHVMGLMPAAAVLMREGHVQPAKDTKLVQLNRDTCYLKPTDVRHSRALRTLLETHKLTLGLPEVPELNWDKATPVPPGAEVISDLDKDFIPAGQSFVESDTKELKRDWEKGIFTINTPKSQAASGWLKGEKVALADATFEITVPKATVALTSLDQQPLSGSKKILLSTAARAQLEGKRGSPIVSEPVTGKVTLRSKITGLKLIPLKGDGTQGQAIPLTPVDGVYTFDLPADQGTHWFLLTAD